MSRLKFKNVGKTIEDRFQEESLSKQKSEVDTLPIGIQMPLQRGSSSSETLFKMNNNVFDQISNNLKVFLMTRKGELLNKPDFGTLLFELYNRSDLEKKDIENIAMQEISSGVDKYFPFISLVDFESFEIEEDSNINANYFLIEIRYIVQGFENNINSIQIKVRRAI